MKSPEQIKNINAAIAKLCGWIHMHDGRWYLKPFFDEAGIMDNPPDYYHDLNACHHMEHTLDCQSPNGESRKRGLKYCAWLGRECQSGGWKGFATAPERCTAFLAMHDLNIDNF
jgi:hypothetical protein